MLMDGTNPLHSLHQSPRYLDIVAVIVVVVKPGLVPYLTRKEIENQLDNFIYLLQLELLELQRNNTNIT